MHYKMNKEHRATFWNSVAKIDTVYIIYTPAKIDFDYWVFITEIVYTVTRKVQLIGVRRVWSDYFKSEKKNPTSIYMNEWKNKKKQHQSSWTKRLAHLSKHMQEFITYNGHLHCWSRRRPLSLAEPRQAALSVYALWWTSLHIPQ